MNILDTTIGGVPCRIRYQEFPAIRGRRESGVPMEPDMPAGFEITAVLDKDGKPAPWLENKLTREEEDRILTHIENLFGG